MILGHDLSEAQQLISHDPTAWGAFMRDTNSGCRTQLAGFCDVSYFEKEVLMSCQSPEPRHAAEYHDCR